MNIRDLILAAADIKTEKVDVPEWGTTVYIKEMNSIERLEWADAAFDGDGETTGRFREQLLVRCLVDESGAPIFTQTDIDALAKKNGGVILRLFTAAQRLNSLRTEAIDDAVKNS